MPISPEIQIFFLVGPWFDPAVFTKKEGPAVIQHRKSISSDDSSVQGNFSIRLIQSPGGSLQILEVLSIMPDTSVGAEISHNLDRKSVW